MDELKELMGEDYKEGMSKEDIQSFFKKQVLSSGEYTNTGKANAEKQELNNTIADLKKQLEEKMTDDDKKKQAAADTQKLIEDLQKQLADSKANQSKMTAISELANAKTLANIKDNDSEYDEFVSNISFEDSEKTDKISKYIAKIINSAYENGKSEAIKNKLGKMGSFKEGQDSQEPEKGSFGKELAQKTKIDTTGKKNFFERK